MRLRNPPSGLRLLRKKPATRSRDSPSCFGASRATCSISSLKLTAPSLDLDPEDLADDATEQALEARVLQPRQRPDGLLLVQLDERAAALLDAELDHRGAD